LILFILVTITLALLLWVRRLNFLFLRQWIGIVFGVAVGAALTFAWFLPIVIKSLPFADQVLLNNIAEFVQFLAPTIVVASIIPANATFMVLCERKFLALLTMRVGPDKVGPNGFLQTAADALKLLFKEDITPHGADKLLFTLAPALFFAPAMIVFMPLLSVASYDPFTASFPKPFESTDINIGVIFILAIVSLGTMSLVMAGWSSNNKYSLMGGMRASAQAISYEIPMVLAMIAMVLFTGTMNLADISSKQAGGILQWNIFANGLLKNLPNLFAHTNGNFTLGLVSLLLSALCVILFLIFVTASTAEVNRIPFDLPEAESELVSGYNTEYTGMKFALFFLAEYTNLFIASGVAAILFLGGAHLPISALAESKLYAVFSNLTFDLPIIGDWGGLLSGLNLTWLIPSTVLLSKIYLMFLLAIWIRATLPRLRQDQLMEFGWKYLIPLTLAIIFIVAAALEYLKI
jgi:NADH-quinone oxidoreductase subunit H